MIPAYRRQSFFELMGHHENWLGADMADVHFVPLRDDDSLKWDLVKYPGTEGELVVYVSHYLTFAIRDNRLVRLSLDSLKKYPCDE